MICDRCGKTQDWKALDEECLGVAMSKPDSDLRGGTMSEAKHTPGPWRTGRGRWVETEDGNYVAGNIHKTADVNLIAAAPDLLEALKETTERLRSVEYDTRHYLNLDGPLLPGEWKRRDPENYAMWERAVDAIAKAEGR